MEKDKREKEVGCGCKKLKGQKRKLRGENMRRYHKKTENKKEERKRGNEHQGTRTLQSA